MNTAGHQFTKPITKPFSFTEDGTYQRYVDEFKGLQINSADAFSGANLRDKSALKKGHTTARVGGKAMLYSLIVAMWVGLILVIAFAMFANGNDCCSMWGWQ